MSKSLRGSVCLNHPDVPAVARCATCSKPICKECVQTHDKVNYCSQLCYENAQRTGMLVDDVKRRKRGAELGRRIRQFVYFLLLLALLAAGYWFYTRNKAKVDRSLQQLQQTVEEKSSTAADTIRSKTVDRKSDYKRRTEGALNE
ncbi:MAG: hypothetical protein GX902_05265 [Lentisphaerae bacterium]|mgnify:CR=1 FL=1|nr:hypothetical protein [Lentisphaerota bacterium]